MFAYEKLLVPQEPVPRASYGRGMSQDWFRREPDTPEPRSSTDDPWAHLSSTSTDTDDDQAVSSTRVMPLVGPDSPVPARGWVAAPAASPTPVAGNPPRTWQPFPAFTPSASPVAGMRPPRPPHTPAQFRQPGQAAPPPSPAVTRSAAVAKTVARRVRAPRLKPIRRTRRLIKLILLLPLLYLIFYVVLGVWTYSRLNTIDVFSDYPGRPGNTMAQTWLFVGSDSRANMTAAQRRQYSTGGTEGLRTDTILLLSKPLTGSPTLVSLPRDSWVTQPAHVKDGRHIAATKTRINSVYNEGGPSLLVQTVEQATGVHIDHYVEVGFLGIVELTDAVGGVGVTIPYPMHDKDSGSNFSKGYRVLNGQQALAFVRDRHSNPMQDLGRVQQQQVLIKALINKAASPSTLLQPWRAWRVSNAVTGSLRVDQGANPLTLAQAGRALRSISNGKGTTTTVPIADPGSVSNGYRVIWDTNAANQLFAGMK